MKRHIWILLVAGGLGVGTSCATTTTTSSTMTTAPSRDVGMVGTVNSVRETVTTTEGNPTAGAVAGGLIGGTLFRGSVGSTVFGAAAGAATGAAVSNAQSSEQRAYEVLVVFEDGSEGVFTYSGYAPWRPGDRVVIERHGLARAA
jgi:outer membrane lipoprotein SlyB